MYKCENCGNIFETPSCWNESYGLPDGGGADFCGCPECHGNYYEVKPCEICGEYHAPDDMYLDICSRCLWDLATVDNLKAYVKSDPKNAVYMVLHDVLGLAYDEDTVSENLITMMMPVFDMMVNSNDITTDMLHDFAMSGDFEKYNFADWILEGRENNG